MSVHAQRLRLALILAAGLTIPVAACGDKELEDDTGNTTGGGGEGGGVSGGSDGGGDEGGDEGGSTGLTDVPEADYPVCEGDDTGGFSGPCCVDVYCIDALSDGSCPSTEDVSADEITGVGLGSGSCECEAPQGPYNPYEGKDGDCCYTVGIQSCEGRPMVVAGGLRTARVVRGRSWAAA